MKNDFFSFPAQTLYCATIFVRNMEKTPKQIVSEMGSRLLQSSHPNKGSLVKSLREAATTLSQIEQPLVTETVSKKQALKLLEAELKPLKKSIIKHDLLKNR